MTFEELWPKLAIPAEFDSMDETDQACWRMVLRQAFEAGGRTLRSERYWLCCGSRNPSHGDITCLEARLGHPERMRFGTAQEHSEWQRR